MLQQHGLGTVVGATKASAGLPQAGDEYDFYRSFPGFQEFCATQGDRILHWYGYFTSYRCSMFYMMSCFLCMTNKQIPLWVAHSSLWMSALVSVFTGACVFCLITSMSQLMQHHGCRSHLRDRNKLTGLDDRFDMVVDANDVILEKVVSIYFLLNSTNRQKVLP